MSQLSDEILNLCKQVLPKGRAFWVPGGKNFEKFLQAFGGDGTNRLGTMERAINDSNSLFSSLIKNGCPLLTHIAAIQLEKGHYQWIAIF